MYKLTSFILAGLLALCVALPVQAAEANLVAESEAYIANLVRLEPAAKTVTLYEKPDPKAPKGEEYKVSEYNNLYFLGNKQTVTGADGKQWYAVEWDVESQEETAFSMMDKKMFVQAEKVKAKALREFEKENVQYEKFYVFGSSNWEKEYIKFTLTNDLPVLDNWERQETLPAKTELLVLSRLTMRGEKWVVTLYQPVDKKRIRRVGDVDLETLEGSTFASGEQAVRDWLAAQKKTFGVKTGGSGKKHHAAWGNAPWEILGASVRNQAGTSLSECEAKNGRGEISYTSKCDTCVKGNEHYLGTDLAIVTFCKERMVVAYWGGAELYGGIRVGHTTRDEVLKVLGREGLLDYYEEQPYVFQFQDAGGKVVRSAEFKNRLHYHASDAKGNSGDMLDLAFDENGRLAMIESDLWGEWLVKESIYEDKQ